MALSIHLFGSVRVEIVGQELTLRPASQMFLLYLLLHRTRFQRREALAAQFWGDLDEVRARRCLNSALWRLRSELDAAAVQVLVTNPQGDIRFSLGDQDRLDVAEFEIIASSNVARPPESLDPAALASLEHAIALYQGDLAENCYYDWVVPERERLRALYLDTLTLLLKAYIHQQAYLSAIATAQHLLNVDPLREDVHRDLMRLYSATNQRGRALQQYLTCCQILQEELNVAPVSETTAVYEQLRATGSVDHETERLVLSVPSQLAPNAQQAADTLDRLQGLLRLVQSEIQHALQVLQRVEPEGR